MPAVGRELHPEEGPLVVCGNAALAPTEGHCRVVLGGWLALAGRLDVKWQRVRRASVQAAQPLLVCNPEVVQRVHLALLGAERVQRHGPVLVLGHALAMLERVPQGVVPCSVVLVRCEGMPQDPLALVRRDDAVALPVDLPDQVLRPCVARQVRGRAEELQRS